MNYIDIGIKPMAESGNKNNAEAIYVTKPLMPEKDAYNNCLDQLWENRWLSNRGVFHKQLEQELIDYLDVPYVSLFNNGTTALLTAIQSLRLQGEVITTPFSFPATTHVLEWNKITPVFCDIDPVRMTIDPCKIEKMITAKTSAILGVHVYGIPCHVEEIQAIADQHGLKVVYDAAHAFSTQINDKPIGCYGDVSMHSFHPTKLFHSGEGGALIYNDPNMKDRIELLKNFGIKNQEEVILPGINGKMNELSAAMGLKVLPLVEEEKKKRQKIRAYYVERLSLIRGIEVPSIPENTTHSEQYFVIRINKEKYGKSRNEVHSLLKTYNYFSRKYFYPLISDYPCYSSLPSANGDMLIEARKASEEILCLPFYGDLDMDHVEKIITLIEQYSRG